MAVAKFIRTGLVDPSGVSKAVAVVNVDGHEIQIEFWYELIDQWGKEGTKQFLCAEALWQTGNKADAIALLKTDATGSVGKDFDTRNWQKNWIDNHPVEVEPVVPEIDPLA